MKNKAVFLDRDGTLIEDRGYISDPEDVALLPGCVESIRRLADAGYLIVVVSNQSGIARGLFDEETLDEVHARFEELLAEEDVGIDGAYYCPYLDGPDAKVKAYRRDSELRKPKPGMLLQAARELNIDLKRSWMIGDSPRDMEAGRLAHCTSILLCDDPDAMPETPGDAVHVASTLLEAADVILGPSKSSAKVTTPSNRAEPPEPRRAPGAGGDESVRLLGEIRDLLQRAHRMRRQDDFSILRLFAALLQMFAIVSAVWGASALLDERADMATARFMMACFLQLGSIAAFAVDRFR